MSIDYRSIGNRIKQARESHGISQQELGEKVHLSTTAIALYESGERKIKNLEILSKIAVALKVTLKELIEGYEEQPIQISFRASKEALNDPKFLESLKKAVNKANDNFSK